MGLGAGSVTRPLDTSFFAGDTLAVARALVGVTLRHRGSAGVVVETEAYTDDPASHFVTRRHAGSIMRDTYGHVYVYRIYGVHLCLNFTTEEDGVGAVLVRALEPVDGVAAMRRRRGVRELESLCSGPGKVVQALGVDPGLTGCRVVDHFELSAPPTPVRVVATPRIGISKATDLPWRFVAEGSRFASRGGLPRRLVAG